MSNVTAAAASPQDELIPSRSFTDVLEIVIYSVCLGIGGPLNVASFFKLLRFYTHSQRNRTQITLLRLNLNVADLLTMFVYTLSQIIWMITYEWYGGDFLCRVCKFFHTFGFYLNSFVIACIAIDRVYSAYSLSAFKSSGRSNTRCRVMLSFAWVFAFALSLPQIFIFRVIELPGMGSFKQCSPIWTIIGYEIDLKLGAPNQTAEHRSLLIEQYHQVVKWERLYNFAHLLFVFWIPALTIVASYVTILCILSSMDSRRRAQGAFRSTLANIFCPVIRKDTNASVVTDPAVRLSSDLTSPRDGAHLDGTATLLARKSSWDPVNSSKSTPSANSCIERFDHLNDVGTGLTTDAISSPPRKFSASTAALPRSKSSSLKTQANRGSHVEPAGQQHTGVGQFALKTIARARQRTKRQAALILLAYLIFWGPYNLLAVLNAFAPNEGSLKQVASVTLPFLNSLIVMNPIANPLIYGLFDRRNSAT